MRPPFTIYPEIQTLTIDMAVLAGKIEGLGLSAPNPQLRKQNQIKTIHSSLAIEGNTLSLEQMTSIIDGKRVVGDLKEIQEVKNAIALYSRISEFSYRSVASFKKAHAILMQDLIADAGKFRNKNVGIIAGGKVKHIAPKPILVPSLMQQIFDFLKTDATHLLIKSAVFHYECEFIHPFADGNGRMGRFWQHLILVSFSPAFEFVPFESIIKDKQEEYYKVLSLCDKKGDSTEFIVFALQAVKSALELVIKEFVFSPTTSKHRLEMAHKIFGSKSFTRKDYILICKNISTATASRDLKVGVESSLLKKSGDQSTSVYHFVQFKQGN